MKVCIIQLSTLSMSSYGCLSTVKSIKASGHEVVLIGSPSDSGIQEIWEHKRDLLLTVLLRFKPDVVGFSVMTPFADYIDPVAQFVKHFLPDVTVIAGGNHVHAIREKVLEENPALDYIYLGDAEAYFVDFLEDLEKGSGKHTELPCIGSREGSGYRINEMSAMNEHEDILTYKAFDYIAPEFDVYSNNLFPNGLAPILLTRGCPYKCTYCAHSHVNDIQRTFKFLNPELFEKQLLDLKKQGVKSLLIHDAEFNLKQSWAFKIMDILKKNNISLYWVNARIDLITEEFVKKLKDLDIQEVSLPIESGSQRIRRDVFNRKTTDEQIYAAFEYAKKYNVLCSTNTIVAAPTETKEDLEMTKEMLFRIDADAPNLKTLIPLPGTILFNKHKDSIRWKNYSQFNLAHDTEDSLFINNFPKCKFNMDNSTFYEEFQLINALIHPLCIILRRKFPLQDANIVFFATCELLEALDILKMFIVSKVRSITVVLPFEMVEEPFQKFKNIKIVRIPGALHKERKTIDSKNRYIKFLYYFLETLEHHSSRFHSLLEIMRDTWKRIDRLKCRAYLRTVTDSLRKDNLSSKEHGFCFFMRNKNVNERSMFFIGHNIGFKEIIGLNKEELCFYQVNFTWDIKIKKTQYFRKMSGGKQRLYKKHIQQS